MKDRTRGDPNDEDDVLGDRGLRHASLILVRLGDRAMQQLKVFLSCTAKFCILQSPNEHVDAVISRNCITARCKPQDGGNGWSVETDFPRGLPDAKTSRLERQGGAPARTLATSSATVRTV